MHHIFLVDTRYTFDILHHMENEQNRRELLETMRQYKAAAARLERVAENQRCGRQGSISSVYRPDPRVPSIGSYQDDLTLLAGLAAASFAAGRVFLVRDGVIGEWCPRAVCGSKESAEALAATIHGHVEELPFEPESIEVDE